MTSFTENYSTVSFVGGLGTKDGTVSAAPITKAMWDVIIAQANPEDRLIFIMGVNGESIDSYGDYTYTAATNRISGPNNSFSECITRMVSLGVVGFSVKVVSVASGDLSVGVFPIVDFDTSNYSWIEITGETGTGTSTGIFAAVGGAYDILETALTGTTLNSKNAIIYTNKDETINSQQQISGPSSTTKGNTLQLIGFNTIPGDMDFGEAYYQSITDVDINGQAETKWVTYDRNNGGTKPIQLIQHNITVRNIWVKNAAATAFGINDGKTNCSFIHCACDDVEEIFTGSVNAFNTAFINCYFGSTRKTTGYVMVPGDRTVLFQVLYCIFTDPGVSFIGLSTAVFSADATVDGCLFRGGERAISCNSSAVYLRASNNVFYNQTISGIRVNATTAAVRANNNIFMPAAAADYGIEIGSSGGTIAGNDNNCFWSIAGAQLTNPIYTGYSGGDKPLLGLNSIEVDPLFADAANKDFRLKPTSPCLHVGRRGIGDGYSNIGVWQRKQYPLRHKVNGLI